MGPPWDPKGGWTHACQGPPGTYRSSSVLRSSSSRGSCCLHPHSSHPQWSGLGCSHLWGWQKEPHFSEMQADSRGQGWGRPWIPLPTQGRAWPSRPGCGPPQCVSSPAAPCMSSVRLSPGTVRVGLVTPPGRSCYSLGSVIFSRRTPTHPSRPSSTFFSLTFTGRAWSAPSSMTPEHWCVWT